MHPREIAKKFNIKVPQAYKLLTPEKVIHWNAEEHFQKYPLVKENCERCALRRCKRPQEPEQWQKDWDGIVTELGGSILFNISFNYTVDTYKEVPDVGPFEVRFATDHEPGIDVGKMFRIYDRDSDDAHILVVGGKYPDYYYYGYILVGTLRYMVFK